MTVEIQELIGWVCLAATRYAEIEVNCSTSLCNHRLLARNQITNQDGKPEAIPITTLF